MVDVPQDRTKRLVRTITRVIALARTTPHRLVAMAESNARHAKKKKRKKKTKKNKGGIQGLMKMQKQWREEGGKGEMSYEKNL